MLSIGAASAADLDLASGWRITQDVRNFGEIQQWFKPEFEADWQPIDRLDYLQLLLAKQPYFGRELRYFNDSPWWYRQEFATSASARGATLRFEGVDCFATVWLNGQLLGQHEGYADLFEFEVATLLRTDRPNVLVVKVSSPWDHEYRYQSEGDRKYPFFAVERNLLKGSYEHADTFVQRDVNPIGIWRPVRLIYHDEVRTVIRAAVTTTLDESHRQADVKLDWPVALVGPAEDAHLTVHIRELGSKRDIASVSRTVRLKGGVNALGATAVLRSPKLWDTWDHGSQSLYEATLELDRPQASKLTEVVHFGVRSVELRRSADETRFFINGRPLYVRGATYWPDLYMSKMSRARYERDIQAAIRGGINAFRVHVHTENPEFYAICDRMGIALVQDNDLTWVFPQTDEFFARAEKHFGVVIDQLKNHPSIVAWIAMNEVGIDPLGGPQHRSPTELALGSQLLAVAHREDPTRPVIEDSMELNSLQSGDRHDYRGSLDEGSYFDIFDSRDKLVTEFGADAPPSAAALQDLPAVTLRLADVLPRVAELHDYQYRLLKYYMEHYRIQKYAPNAGYFQFMWIDFSPQSFYGVYDYWGGAKTEGLGGGLRAMMESNQPVGIFMEHNARPVALHAVNDSLTDLGNVVARWRMSTSTGVIAQGSQRARLGPDSHVRIRDFNMAVNADEKYQVVLDLLAADGKTLAHNVYDNAFQAQPRPEGYADRMDDELGMRLWWAGQKK